MSTSGTAECGNSSHQVSDYFDFNRNNFDLIRLCAALQVVLVHVGAHLSSPPLLHAVNTVASYFPGVPIFYFVSGFLISRSFERGRSLRDFAVNRGLRIYPALWVCLLVSLGSVASAGYDLRTVEITELLKWLACQLTFIQFYNPEFLRQYGVGTLNGSLWTISVELQFYFLVPLLYSLIRRTHNRRTNIFLGCLIVVFLGLNQWYLRLFSNAPEAFNLKVLHMTFVPWFYMFLTGVLCQRNIKQLWKIISGKWWLIPSLLVGVIGCQLTGVSGGGNHIGPLAFCLLCLLVVACAYTRPQISEQLLRKNDISYGCYIYHMPVANFLRQTGFSGALGAVSALVITVLLASPPGNSSNCPH